MVVNSTQPNSLLHKKMSQILKLSHYLFIDCNDELFFKTFQNIVAMLSPCNIKPLSSEENILLTPHNCISSTCHDSNSSVSQILRIEVSFYGVKKTKSYQEEVRRPRIILQTEQLVHVGKLEYLKRCHLSPICVIWDFSDAHIRWADANHIGRSFALIPTMHQTRMGSYPITNLIPLINRSLDVVMFGAITRRRQIVLQKIRQEFSHWNYIYKTDYDLNRMKEAYLNTKICLIIHSYNPYSAGEYHRLSEMVPSGCVPVVESILDNFATDAYASCGGVVFASINQILNVTQFLLSHISQSSLSLARTENTFLRAKWWQEGIRWDMLLSSSSMIEMC